jgi:hypothetical protein
MQRSVDQSFQDAKQPFARGFAALFAGAFFSACAAEEPIDTDGPDFVDSTEVVGQYRAQIETGPYRQYQTQESSKIRTTTTPVLLRFGVSDAWEIRLDTDGKTWQTVPQSEQRGMADIAVGFKWHVQDKNAEKNSPAISLIGQAELPTGSQNMRGHGVRPSVRSVVGWELPNGYGIGVMPGIKYDRSDDGHGFFSASLGLSISKWWTGKFRSFVEVSAPQIARASNGGVVAYKDIGAAYIVSNGLEIGGRMGWRANNNTPSNYYLLMLAAKF